MELDKYIKELLFFNDTIIISNFGGFEKFTESAQIDQDTGIIHPPRVKVKFRPELTKASGVLSNYIAEKENISKDEAETKINKAVQTWENDLKGGSKIIISDIGIISLDKSSNKNFELTGSLSDFPEAFGLPTLNVEEQIPKNIKNLDKQTNKPEKEKSTSKKEVKIPVVKKTAEPKVKVKTDPVKKKKIIITALIAIPIIALIVFAALNFDLVTSKFKVTKEYVSSIFTNDSETEEDLNNNNTANENTNNETDSIIENTKLVLENYTVINAATNNPLTIDKNSIESIKKVHIIAGSFKNKKFANRLKSKLIKKGFNVEILPISQDYYRVSIGAFENIDDAIKDFERIHMLDNNINVWILIN
ncbi:MAG: SPOR domain-containing protein [Bacteroidales bacterium]|nr:SPOR domain-containing protein [Bacteroidales bacterium]MBN2756183.1 SPOR domain-containing protein [Bacteroidales bacterium]